MLDILLYTKDANSKLRYVLDNISTYLKINFLLTTDLDHFHSATHSAKVVYDDKMDFDGIKIPNTEYLSNFDLDKEIEFQTELKFHNQFANFDLFSAIFFLLARVEEYKNIEPDDHGRFTVFSSILYEKGLHRTPIIEEWLISFRNQMEFECGHQLGFVSKYEFISTIDIDHIYAFKGRPWPKKTLSKVYDHLKNNQEKLRFRKLDQDPFDQYEWLNARHKALHILPLYFILTAQRSKFDRSLSPQSKAFKEKVGYLAQNGNIGVHPSYRSNDVKGQMGEEKSQLESIIDKPIYCSRQHFLRLHFPETYRVLLDNGIRKDYSMGYANDVGFRAGTARPFKWYDLLNDSPTELIIFPFQVMDVSLNRYLKLNPQDALDLVNEIITKIKNVKGTFSLIWHNSSLADFEGWNNWAETYEQILFSATNN